MPRRHISYYEFTKNWYDPEHIVPPPADLEIMSCPRCHYNVPVDQDLTDYKTLYKRQDMLMRQQHRLFTNYIKDLCEEFPMIDEFIDKRNQELRAALKMLLEGFKQNLEPPDSNSEPPL